LYIPGLNIKETAPVGLMILRVVLGIAFAVHGWMKWQTGIDGVAGFFGSIGVPAPELMAWVVTIVELVGGIFLIIGFLTQFVSILLLLDMLGAILFARVSGPFIEGGGISWEKEAVFAAAAVCLILAGPGIWSVDDIVIDTRTRPSTA
jgi:putative oxidoreductase